MVITDWYEFEIGYTKYKAMFKITKEGIDVVDVRVQKCWYSNDVYGRIAKYNDLPPNKKGWKKGNADDILFIKRKTVSAMNIDPYEDYEYVDYDEW